MSALRLPTQCRIDLRDRDSLSPVPVFATTMSMWPHHTEEAALHRWNLAKHIVGAQLTVSCFSQAWYLDQLVPHKCPQCLPGSGGLWTPCQKLQAQASQQSCRSETIALGPWGGFGSLIRPLKGKDWPADSRSGRSRFLFKAPSSSRINDGL